LPRRQLVRKRRVSSNLLDSWKKSILLRQACKPDAARLNHTERKTGERDSRSHCIKRNLRPLRATPFPDFGTTLACFATQNDAPPGSDPIDAVGLLGYGDTKKLVFPMLLQWQNKKWITRLIEFQPLRNDLLQTSLFDGRITGITQCRFRLCHVGDRFP